MIMIFSEHILPFNTAQDIIHQTISLYFYWHVLRNVFFSIATTWQKLWQKLCSALAFIDLPHISFVIYMDGIKQQFAWMYATECHANGFLLEYKRSVALPVPFNTRVVFGFVSGIAEAIHIRYSCHCLWANEFEYLLCSICWQRAQSFLFTRTDDFKFFDFSNFLIK